ncbi:hypothetical protein [Desulfosporosinus hippei]|uniref:Initiator Replication protein n=1 Tax=Desulfosporosinus hippei DSM 8344 TaxID=1121419 RepID=A0A1G8CCT7_9FIRM|nr:hypothetical protein [Desulfosporosinus hippei]SDH43225.1 hypothetical protein SAMN05443529_11363 [Desulfosporosinus hippei DSM 8344]
MATRKGLYRQKAQDSKSETRTQEQDNSLKPFVQQEYFIELHTTHFPVLGSDITQTISEGIPRLRHAPIDVDRDNCSVDISGKGKIEMVLDENEDVFEDRGVMDIESAQRNIRLSQVQLFQYLLYQFNQHKQKKITLDIRNYFELRGITRRKENVDRFYQDLFILSSISFDLVGKNSGVSERIVEKLLTVKRALSAGGEEIGFSVKGRKVATVIVELGEWIQKLKLKQFILIPKVFFEYTAPNQSPAILLSLKFNQLCRVNSGKGRNKKVSVKSLLGTLGVTEKDVAKQGGQYYQALLENCFKLLEGEGYAIAFENNGACVSKGFLENIVLYRNDGLESHYSIRKIRAHTDKK